MAITFRIDPEASRVRVTVRGSVTPDEVLQKPARPRRGSRISQGLVLAFREEAEATEWMRAAKPQV